MADTKTRAPARAKVSKEGDRALLVERTFDAKRERVWRAMTKPELVAQWWGRGNPLTIERMDVERGGHWRFVERANGEEHGFEGRYGEVVPGQRIVQTFEWDGMPAFPSRETMTLEDAGEDRTLMRTRVEFFTPDERDGMMQAGMEDGMNQSYEALDRLLASGV